MIRALLPVLGLGLGVFGLTLGITLGIFGSGLQHVEYAHPWWALALLGPIAAVLLRAAIWPRPATMRFSRVRTAGHVGPGLAARVAELPDGLRLAAALLIVLALTRPQSTREYDTIKHKGIDIAIALDMSDSMQNDDMYPNRLEAAKAVIDDFIERRPLDRISLVAFGAQASTVAPLTMDHAVLRALLSRMRLGVMDGSRTAIGAGLGIALNRLEESEAESKVIVLLTDGVHNADGLDPDTAAQEAADRDILIYTILIGRDVGRSVDPAQLERLASATGGYAYTAVDYEDLTTSFQDLLNKLETSELEGNKLRAELYHWLLWPALLLLGLDIALRNTRLRRFP